MSSTKILLDLNYPGFQDDLFGLEPNDLRGVLEALRKIRSLDWPTFYKDRGLNLEQIKGADRGRFTIRLSQRSRAVVRRDGDYLRFVALHTDHDRAYGKK
jgi:hypothetical protein